MNERIKELWERACTRYSVYETLKPQDERKIIPDIFAELIVREYETLLPEICPWDSPKDSPMKGWHVQFVARKHFGVEE
jgi:hypothetical protein